MAGVGGSVRCYTCSPSSSFFLRKAPSPVRFRLKFRFRFRINALFGDWGLGNRKNSLSFSSTHQHQFTFSLTDTDTVRVSVLSSISDVPAKEWDACAVDASGPHSFNPFLSHAFLSALEHSASAVRETGWMPHHIVAKDQANNILAVVPLYLKTYALTFSFHPFTFLVFLSFPSLSSLADIPTVNLFLITLGPMLTIHTDTNITPSYNLVCPSPLSPVQESCFVTPPSKIKSLTLLSLQ